MQLHYSRDLTRFIISDSGTPIKNVTPIVARSKMSGGFTTSPLKKKSCMAASFLLP